MSAIRLAAAIVLFLLLPSAATPQEQVTSIEGLQLHSSFWMNLHHWLHAEASEPKNRFDVSRISADDRAAWEAAVRYYVTSGLAKRDLRRGQGMTDISEALSFEGPLRTLPALPDDHRRVLESAAIVYRKHQWPADNGANREWIADVSSKLKTISARVLPRLAAFYQLPWYVGSTPVRVDIVNVGNARGGYTWVRPRVHTVIDGADKAYQGWLGVEMLLHEASHGLTDPLADAIAAEAKATGKKDDGTLWHTIQFYIVGEVMKRVLAADGITFTPYMYETGLFDRAWKRFKLGVETEIGAYLDGRQPLDAAIRRVVAAALD